MSEPLVSIITPTFNHALFIADCIESVRSQTYGSWEMIIIDDGSEDGTAQIARSYTLVDKRVQLVEQSHHGPGRLDATYNNALRRARGDWIAILEGDDLWLPTRLEVQVQHIQPQTIVIYSAYFDEIEGKLQPGMRPPFVGALSTREFTRYLLLNQSNMIAVTQLIRRDCLDTIGGFQQRGSPAAVDMATMLELVRLPGTVVYVPEPLGVWRHHHSQSTNLRGLEIAKFNASLVLEYFDSLTEQDREALHIKRRDLVEVRREYVAAAAFGLMRRRLKAGDRESILSLARQTWQYGGFKRKVQAVFAVGGAIGGFDFEPVLAVTERMNPVGTRLQKQSVVNRESSSFK